VKQLFKFCFFVFFLMGFFSACDRELKEHKVPPAVLKKMERLYDPALKVKEIAGWITLDPQVAPNFLPEQTVLFVYARPVGEDSGPPLAVKRYNYFEFPFEYTIGPVDVMIPGVEFDGMVSLSARLDRDGDPKAGPGDIFGQLDVAAGTKDADIVLNQEVAGSHKNITGIISLSPDLPQIKLTGPNVVFIIVRPAGVQSGPPLAVQRLLDVEWPLQFDIGQGDVMMPGVQFEGSLTLKVRIDSDGDPRPGPGDIEGTINASAGDTNVTLVLDKVIPG